MHEFKHGELKSGPGGKGGPVKSRKQAIAIALEKAGDSKYESEGRNKRNLHRTEKKEAEGKTGQQEREGKSYVGASSKREITRSMGDENARKASAIAAHFARFRAEAGRDGQDQRPSSQHSSRSQGCELSPHRSGRLPRLGAQPRTHSEPAADKGRMMRARPLTGNALQ
jgi:hypothetical protein